MKLSTLILVTTLVFSISRSAFACSCAQYDIFDVIINSDTILLVETTDIHVIEEVGRGEYSLGKRRASYNVINAYKGNAADIPYLESANSAPCCMCQTAITIDRYILFSKNGEGVRLNTCSPSGRISEHNEHLLEIIPLIVNKSEPHEFSGTVDEGWPPKFTEFGSGSSIELLGYHGEYRKSEVVFNGFLLSDGRIFVTDILKEKEI